MGREDQGSGYSAEYEEFPSYRITTLHPRTYNEARTIGEHFRSGTPVIMNLSEMDDSGRQAPGRLRRGPDLRPARADGTGDREGLPAQPAQRHGDGPGQGPHCRERLLQPVLTTAPVRRGAFAPATERCALRRPRWILLPGTMGWWPVPMGRATGVRGTRRDAVDDAVLECRRICAVPVLLLIIASIVVEVARQFARVVAPGRRHRDRPRARLYEHGSSGEDAAAAHSAPPTWADKS